MEESRKKIELHLKKLLDDVGEILLLLREGEQNLAEEMASLCFVKRRNIDFMHSCFIIYQELVKLRLLKTEEIKPKEAVDGGLLKEDFLKEIFDE